MTTEEFKEEIKKLGLILEYKHNKILEIERYFVKDETCVDDEYYVYVDINDECVVDMDDRILADLEKRRELFNIVMRYAATPIKEREPKHYFKYRLKPLYKGMEVSYLTYTYDETYEFDFYSEEANGYKMIFEENDPILDKVNLEMYDKIRVDKFGNEIKNKN